MAETKTNPKTEETKTTVTKVTKTPKASLSKPIAKKSSTEEMLKKHSQMIQFLQNVLSEMETDIKRMKLILSQLAKFDPDKPELFESIEKDAEKVIGGGELKTYTEEDVEVVEGKFDGYFMVGADQKKYPVPLNYSSKTKLVPGDILKLKIMSDGRFIYKLIQAIERKHIRSTLSKTDDNKFIAITDDGKTYFLNQAAVTFFKGKPGDELYILINEKEDGGFAAIEAIIKK
ncbi:MAG: hypothetical protein WC872_04185 [Candidatus Absconditabacterales bacterium]